MAGADWQPPRCIHGYIVLGCPHDDCPTQLAYLDQQDAAMRDYQLRQREAFLEAFGVLSDRFKTVFTPIITRMGEVFLDVAKKMAPVVETILSLNVHTRLWRIAIEQADIPESDIRDIDTVNAEVIMWNRRRVSLRQYIEPEQPKAQGGFVAGPARLTVLNSEGVWTGMVKNVRLR